MLKVTLLNAKALSRQHLFTTMTINCVYIVLALALAATTNQRHLLLPMTYGNSK